MINERVHSFCEQWAAHGTALLSSFEIFFDQFIVLAVDESQHLPSGCSIDSSVSLIRELQSQIGIDLLDRSNIAIRQNDKTKIFRLSAIKPAVENGEIHPEDLVYNNLVPNISELRDNWLIPARDSWMKRFFESVTT